MGFKIPLVLFWTFCFQIALACVRVEDDVMYYESSIPDITSNGSIINKIFFQTGNPTLACVIDKYDINYQPFANIKIHQNILFVLGVFYLTCFLYAGLRGSSFHQITGIFITVHCGIILSVFHSILLVHEATARLPFGVGSCLPVAFIYFLLQVIYCMRLPGRFNIMVVLIVTWIYGLMIPILPCVKYFNQTSYRVYYRYDDTCPVNTAYTKTSKPLHILMWLMSFIGNADAATLYRKETEYASFAICIFFLIWLHRYVYKNSYKPLMYNIIKDSVSFILVGHSEHPHLMAAVCLGHMIVQPKLLYQNIITLGVCATAFLFDTYYISLVRMTFFMPLSALIYDQKYKIGTKWWYPYVFIRFATFAFTTNSPYTTYTHIVFAMDYFFCYYDPTIVPYLFNVLPPELINIIWLFFRYGYDTTRDYCYRIFYSLADHYKMFVVVDNRPLGIRLFDGLTHVLHAITFKVCTVNNVPQNYNHNHEYTPTGARIDAYTVDCKRRHMPSGDSLFETEVVSTQPNFDHYVQQPTHVLPYMMYVPPSLKWLTWIFNLTMCLALKFFVVVFNIVPSYVIFVIVILLQFNYSQGLEVVETIVGEEILYDLNFHPTEYVTMTAIITLLAFYIVHVLKQVRQNPYILIQLTTSALLMYFLPAYGVFAALGINVLVNLINYRYLLTPSLDLIRLITWLAFIISIQLSTYSLLWHPIVTLYNVACYHGVATVLGATLALIGFVVIFDFKMSTCFNPREILTKDLTTGKIIDRSYQDSLLGYLFFGTTIYATTPVIKAVTNSLLYTTSDLVDKWMSTHNKPTDVAKTLVRNAQKIGCLKDLIEDLNNEEFAKDVYLSATPKAAIPLCSLGYISTTEGAPLANAFPINTHAGPVIVCNYHAVKTQNKDDVLKEINFKNTYSDTTCKLISSCSQSDLALYKPTKLNGPCFKVGSITLGKTYIWCGVCPPYTTVEHKFCVPLKLGPYGAHSGVPPSNGDSGSVLIDPENGHVAGIKWACAVNDEGALLPINYYLDAASLNLLKFPKKAFSSNSLVDAKHEFWESFVTNKEAAVKDFDDAMASGDQSKIDEALKKVHKVVQLGKSMQQEHTGRLTAEKAKTKLQQHKCDDLNKEVLETMRRIDEKIAMYNIRIENLGEDNPQLVHLRAERERLETELKGVVNEINATVKQEHRDEFLDLCRRIGALGAEKAKTKTLLVVAEEGNDILEGYRARNKEIQREIDELLQKIEQYREKFPLLANRMPGGIKPVRFPIVYKVDDEWHTHLSDKVHIISGTHPAADPTIVKMGAEYGYPKQKLWKKVLQTNTTSAEWAQQYLSGAAPNNFLNYIKKLLYWPETNYEANCPNCGKQFSCSFKSSEENHTCTKECHQSIVSGISRHLNTCPANYVDLAGHIPVYHLGQDSVTIDCDKIVYEGVTCGANHKCAVSAPEMRNLIDANPKFKLNQWLCVSDDQGPIIYIRRHCIDTLRARVPLVQAKLVSNAHLMDAVCELHDRMNDLSFQVNSMEFKSLRKNTPPPSLKNVPIGPKTENNPHDLESKDHNTIPFATPKPQRVQINANAAPFTPRQRPQAKGTSTNRDPSNDRNRVLTCFTSKKGHNSAVEGICACPKHNMCVEWDNTNSIEVGVRDCKCHLCTDKVCIWCNTTGHYTDECAQQKEKNCSECQSNCDSWFQNIKSNRSHCANGCGKSGQCIVCLVEGHHSAACPTLFRTNLTMDKSKVTLPVGRDHWRHIFHFSSNNGQSKVQRQFGNFHRPSLSQTNQPT